MNPTQNKIERIKENIFYRSQDSIINYENFNWHVYRKNIDTDKVNSSQALAIDFWGCLKLSPFKNQIINYIFYKECERWEVKLEYEDKSLLNEKKSTQIDVVLESDSSAIFIESKFAEFNGGPCSQTKKRKSGKRQCNGNYEEQLNPVKNVRSYCALTGKGIKYWDYIDKIASLKKNEKHQPCPIKGGEFQWIRNVCFAEAYAKKNDINSESYLVYFKSKKCSISNKVEKQTYLGKLKGKIINPNSFKPLSYNKLLDKVLLFLESLDQNERQVWVELKLWMESKEQKLKTV